MNFLWSQREVLNCHFFSAPSWTKLHEINRGGKTDVLVEKETGSFLPDKFFTKRLKTSENLSTNERDPWCIYSNFRLRGTV